jgi:P-type Ca2+ transporter type 2C
LAGDLSPAGLSQSEASARLRSEGPNELPRRGHRTIFRIAADVFREPMFVLLVGAGVVYLFLGDLGEALLLLVFATVSVVITIVQETRSERVLEALRDLTSPRALVIREGARRRIPGREVVRGDVLVVAEGDRVPADAVLMAGHDIETDESLLTGESVPVRKKTGKLVGDEGARPGGDDLPVVFSGTLVVRGHGLAEVTATGSRSEIGKIGQALGTIETEPPLLRRQTQRLVNVVAAAGLMVSIVVVLLYGLFRGSWLDGLLGGLALSMSMLPEEFPLVLTVFMVMGAWRISQARVLTRRAAAIETLGAATVLCSDKTGTLTQNRMSVVELRREGKVLPLSDLANAHPTTEFRELAEYGVLASAKDPYDPMEKAIHALGDAFSESKHSSSRDWALVRSYGITPTLLAMTQVWQKPGGGAPVIAAKGAPEAIATLCNLDQARLAAVRRFVDDMASRGLRVLGVARGAFAGPELPDTQRGFAFEFVGLIGLADPLRPTVPTAVEECRTAGIRVAMVTGDYPTTARAIAKQAGLSSERIVTGDEVAAMDDAELARQVRSASVFARIMPEQKLRVVNALKANGEVVAMTGDGVNDAPSLKSAHIGIAMGERGTDVAREAAAIVLLDDDFGSIVRTIRLGRRIYDNLRKAMGYVLAVHVPIAGLALLPLLFGLPLILTPVHIAFLEMVIDPVCSIVFEAEPAEADVMARPPRNPRSPLFSGSLVAWSLFQGILVLVLVAAIYVIALRNGLAHPEARALAFVSLVFANLGLIFANRSFGSSLVLGLRQANTALWIVVVSMAVLLSIVFLWLPARTLFQFGPLHLDDVAICFAAGLATLIALDLLKPIWRRRLAT